MAKVNNLPASAYAKPHSMSGGPMKINKPADPTKQVAGDFKPGKATARVSLGDPARDDVKSDGIETRGNGAAIKGRIARGPMA